MYGWVDDGGWKGSRGGWISVWVGERDGRVDKMDGRMWGGWISVCVGERDGRVDKMDGRMWGAWMVYWQ